MTKKGFTLIETVVTAIILVLLSETLIGFVLWSYKTYYYTFQQTQAINEAKWGIETISKELKEAKEGHNGSFQLEKADDFELIFYSDVDKDNQVERVRYFLEETNLKRGVINPSGWPIFYPFKREKINILSKYILNDSNPIFLYYNENWPEDTDNNPPSSSVQLSEVKLIQVLLEINIDPNRLPSDFILESDVQIRSLKTNG